MIRFQAMTQPSHRVTENADKVVIHDLEVFSAYDPAIDGDHDAELKSFDNDRVESIVESTKRYMEKGSFPRLVVMHERDGNEPKSCIGRFTKIHYQERNGVGYIVGDCEVERAAFDKLLATNAFPRRSAEIWQDHNHLSEVALLGRETPRRPLPDTHFSRKGNRVTFSRSLRFDMGTVGGGLSTFVPDTKDINMADDLREEMSSMKAAMEELRNEFKKRFAEDDDETIDMSAYERDDDDKETMEADDMLQQQFAEEMPEEIHIDIGSHDQVDEDEDEDEEEDSADAVFPASRLGSSDMFAMRRENTRMARELKSLRTQLSREKFSRELDAMEQDGYRIPAERRDALLGELLASRNPTELIDTWRDLFARDPMGVRIDMSRATIPQSSQIHASDVSELVREFAGKPEEFRKAINSRIKR